MARVATQLMLGKKLPELGLKPRKIPHFGVKESVFPFDKLPEVDPILGPEMRSTGEVLGMAGSFGEAFFKAQEAAKPRLPTEGTVLISVNEKNADVLEVAREFAALGFKIRATNGTHKFLTDSGVPCERINKMNESRPNIVDAIMSREIQMVINTPVGRWSKVDDSYIRKNAIRFQVPYMTTLPAALASVKGIAAQRKSKTTVRSLQEYHRTIG
jgi:carbamoyl-phosphate synthase large subunit